MIYLFVTKAAVRNARCVVFCLSSFARRFANVQSPGEDMKKVVYKNINYLFEQITLCSNK